MEELTQKDYEGLANLRFALRRFERFSEQEARRAGLSPQQHQALLAIRGFPLGEKVSVGALAERLCSRPQSTSELLTRLARLGLITREPSAGDGRQVEIGLTSQGEEILRTLSSVHRSELQRVGVRLKALLELLTQESGSL